MENLLHQLMEAQSLPLLFAIIAIFIYTLAWGASKLVEEAVTLSLRCGIPKILIGATIISIGTTLPEASVSVFAAITGNPELALGNAVGSIICDTGLILGLATVLSPPPLNKKIVNRQGWIQLGAGILLVLACIPYRNLNKTFLEGGSLPQYIGFVFLFLLIIYLWWTLKCVKTDNEETTANEENGNRGSSSTTYTLFKVFFSIVTIVISSRILIPAVTETAVRLHVPDSIIAATVVAFGTSLPELITCLTAVTKGHGELAIGNIIGADILNILFVAGSASAVTMGGLSAPPHFFQILFPAMLIILITFRIGITFSKDKLSRPFGFILLGIYATFTIMSYI